MTDTDAMLRELRAEIAVREARLARTNKEIESLRQVIQMVEATAQANAQACAEARAEEAREAARNAPDTVPRSDYRSPLSDVMHEVLMEERPLHLQEITRRVLAKGHEYGGTHPFIKVIKTYLSTRTRFKKAGRHGWWTLAEEPPK